MSAKVDQIKTYLLLEAAKPQMGRLAALQDWFQQTLDLSITSAQKKLNTDQRRELFTWLAEETALGESLPMANFAND